MGLNECWHKVSYCLESLLTFIFMAFLSVLWDWGDLQPWHCMHWLSFRSSLFFRLYDQPHAETLAGTSTHCNVTRINRVWSYWIHKYKHYLNSIGQIKKAKQLLNVNFQFITEVPNWEMYLSSINIIDIHNALNQQPRTSYLPNVPSIHGIATSCWDLVQLYCLELHLKPWTMTVIQCIMQQGGTSICQHP